MLPPIVMGFEPNGFLQNPAESTNVKCHSAGWSGIPYRNSFWQSRKTCCMPPEYTEDIEWLEARGCPLRLDAPCQYERDARRTVVACGLEADLTTSRLQVYTWNFKGLYDSLWYSCQGTSIGEAGQTANETRTRVSKARREETSSRGVLGKCASTTPGNTERLHVRIAISTRRPVALSCTCGNVQTILANSDGKCSQPSHYCYRAVKLWR